MCTFFPIYTDSLYIVHNRLRCVGYQPVDHLLQCLLQFLAVCCSVAQCNTVCSSMLQCVAVCSSVLQWSTDAFAIAIVHQCVAVCCSVLQCSRVCPLRRFHCCSVSQCVAVCHSVLQCVAVYCSVWQCVAVRCSALQCVAVRCSVLQWMNTQRTVMQHDTLVYVYHWEQKIYTANGKWTLHCNHIRCTSNHVRYRVAKTHMMPYLYTSFSAKEPYK